MELISLIISIANIIIVPFVILYFNNKHNKSLEYFKLSEDQRLRLIKEILAMYNSCIHGNSSKLWNVDNRLLNSELLVLLFNDKIVYKYYKFWMDAKKDLKNVNLEPVLVDIVYELRRDYYHNTRITKDMIKEMLLSE